MWVELCVNSMLFILELTEITTLQTYLEYILHNFKICTFLVTFILV